MTPLSEITSFWWTKTERTGYRLTASYDETLEYLRRLESASPWLRVTSYGTSGQGRPLPLVIASKDRAFTPEAARATGKAIVLVQCGIHSGEIEGKDACLALLREIAVLHSRDELLDHVILLVLPIFSVDAHERAGPFNRINQNGPENAGWRTTPIGLNLNRDYLKADSPEMRAMLGNVFTKWWPDLFVDTHTTDGADYRHDVTTLYNRGPGTPAPLARWLDQAFEGRVLSALTAMGHLPAPYLWFRRGDDPASGVALGDSPPRFSTGYGPLQCTPALLVETHMLKPYETRVRATFDLIVALLAEVNARPAALKGAVAAAQAEVMERGRERDPARRAVALAARIGPDSVLFAYKGRATRREMSDVTGAPVARYSEAPWDTLIPLFRDLEPALVVRQPAGYLVPREWSACVERLAVHGVRVRRFAKAWTDSVEMARILEWSAAPRPAEGHFPISVTKLELVGKRRTFRPGDLWVPLDQRPALVAVHLLEPQAPDGLLHWNAFDTIFERKEYGEDYVVEPLARQMLKDDPALAREFQARLAADSSFARSPFARTDFFYRRTRWADPEQDLYPVARALQAPPESVLEP